MVKAIIFDCFGVLITDVFNAMHEELRVRDADAARVVDGYVADLNRGTLPRQEFMAKAGAVFSLTWEELRTRVEGKEVRNNVVFDYARELRKQYKTALLTNISPEAFWRRFKPNELDPYFDAIVLSGEIGFIKPEAQAYLIAAQRLDVQPAECVMVDDRQICVDGAKAVGMQAILYESLPQLKADLAKLLATPL